MQGKGDSNNANFQAPMNFQTQQPPSRVIETKKGTQTSHNKPDINTNNNNNIGDQDGGASEGDFNLVNSALSGSGSLFF